MFLNWWACDPEVGGQNIWIGWRLCCFLLRVCPVENHRSCPHGAALDPNAGGRRGWRGSLLMSEAMWDQKRLRYRMGYSDGSRPRPTPPLSELRYAGAQTCSSEAQRLSGQMKMILKITTNPGNTAGKPPGLKNKLADVFFNNARETPHSWQPSQDVPHTPVDESLHTGGVVCIFPLYLRAEEDRSS